MRSFVAVVLVCSLGLAGAVAEEKADKAGKKYPLGTWVRSAGGEKMTFDIKAAGLTIQLKGERVNVTLEADYGVTADGTLFAVITKVDSKDTTGGPQKGDLFSFAYTFNKKEMTISDLKGTRVNEQAQKHIEGVYALAKKKAE